MGPLALIVNGRFLRVAPTGMQRAARTLVSALRESGLRFEVVAPRGTSDELIDRHVGRLPGRVGDILWEQLVLPVAVRRDYVLSPTNLAPLAARRSIVWTHDLAPLLHPEWFASSQVRLYARLMLAAARRAEFVFVPSQQVAEEVAAIGVDRRRVGVLRTPIDPQFHPSSRADVDAVRARYELHQPYAVVIGAYDPRKNAEFAARVHLKAVSRVPHELLLVGRVHGIFAPVNLPTAPTIRQPGYVDDGELPALLAGAAALLAPSRYEGFGLTPAEAMACGTPAIVSDIPAHRESTWGLARLIPLDDVETWTTALLEALRGDVEVPALPRWTKVEEAEQFKTALPPQIRERVTSATSSA